MHHQVATMSTARFALYTHQRKAERNLESEQREIELLKSGGNGQSVASKEIN